MITHSIDAYKIKTKTHNKFLITKFKVAKASCETGPFKLVYMQNKTLIGGSIASFLHLCCYSISRKSEKGNKF